VSANEPDVIDIDLGAELRSFEFAHSLPYSLRRLNRFRRHLAFASSKNERSLEPCVFSLKASGAARHSVWVICRQHPVETLSSYLGEYLMMLASEDVRVSAVNWWFVIVANAGGCRLGTSRYTTDGIDMNRHWGLHTAPKEAIRIMNCMAAAECDLVLDIHGDESTTAPYLHLGAATLQPQSNAAARERRFHEFLQRHSEPFGFSTYCDPQAPNGTPGLSIYGLFRRFGCSGVILEIPLSRNRALEPTSSQTLASLNQMASHVYGAVLTCLE
jgi:hypothetical protein